MERRESEYTDIFVEMFYNQPENWANDSILGEVDSEEIRSYGKLFNEEAELPPNAIRFLRESQYGSGIIKYSDDEFTGYLKLLLEYNTMHIQMLVLRDNEVYMMQISKASSKPVKLVYGNSELKEEFDQIFGISQEA